MGRAGLVVVPAPDRDGLQRVVALLRTVPGIARIEVEGLTEDEARLAIEVSYPVQLAQVLGRALQGRVRSCVPAGPGGRIVLDARPPETTPAEDRPAPDDDGEGAVDRAPIVDTDAVTIDEDAPTDDGGASGSDAGPRDGTAGGAPGRGPGAGRPTAGRDTSTPGGAAPPRGANASSRGPAGPRTTTGDPGPASAEGDRTSTGDTTQDGAGAGDRARRPWGRRGPRSSRAGRGTSAQEDAPRPGDDGQRGAPEPLDPAVVAEALGGAVDDTPGLSALVYDRELRIRAVAGVDPDATDGAVLLGRPVVHAFPVAARRPLAAALTAALDGRERTVALPDAEGEERLEAVCRPVGPRGSGGVCVVRDLEVLGGGALLVEAQAAFEITFRHSPIGQGLLSRTGRWLRVNGALAELLGRTEDDLVGEEAVDAMHPDDRLDERARLRALVDGTDDHYVVATRFLHLDGHVVRTHTRMTRIAGDAGEARGFVAQVVDAAAWRRFRGA